MPLSAGTKLGPYEILALIGKGGMGEVYKARDTRLDRIVALKVSDAQFSERFEREARAIAALNHPGICTLHDVGPDYLVMEYIDGAPLKGPLPLEQTLKYAAQICDALDAAHKKGISHRDLKPANILVTKQGIKLLDFGLAKLKTAVAKPVDEATLTMALTGRNEIVGTLYYMSPEQLQGQANGQEIDVRSDIFSFGIVLYEMLTGKVAFEGTSPASVMGAILERPAPSVADIAPLALNCVLKRCLEKDPDNRWQSARDLRAALDLVSVQSLGPIAHPAQVVAAPSRLHARIATVAAAVFAITTAIAWWAPWRSAPAPPLVAHLSLLPPENASVGELAISPDGSLLAFVAIQEGKRHILLRPLAGEESRPLNGTEDATTLFWSPDSRQLGFFVPGNLKRIDVSSGAITVVCPLRERMREYDSGTWSEDGTILFSQNSGNLANFGLYRVPATGGQPVRVTVLDPKQQDALNTRPLFLPGGRRFLFTLLSNLGQPRSGIYLGSLDSPEIRQVLPGASLTAFSPSIDGLGRLYFDPPDGKPEIVWQTFNPSTGQLSGTPVHVADQVDMNYAYPASVSVSRNGILVYRPTPGGRQLIWFTREGKADGTVSVSSTNEFALSPDQTKLMAPVSRTALAKDVRANVFRSLWLSDLSRVDSTATRFTFVDQVEDHMAGPLFSPDGTRAAFYRKPPGSPKGVYRIYAKAVNGAGQEELLLETDPTLALDQWSPKGRFLVYNLEAEKSGRDIWVLPLTGDRQPKPYAQTEAVEVSGKLSPDEQWMAYSTVESGQQQVVVRPFPNYSGGVRQVSLDGGDRPMWGADGKELYFLGLEGKLMVVDVQPAPPGGLLQFGQPRPLFQTDGYALSGAGRYAPSRDGRRFLFVANGTSSSPFTVILNAGQ